MSSKQGPRTAGMRTAANAASHRHHQDRMLGICEEGAA